MNPFEANTFIWVKNRGVCRITCPKSEESLVHLACVLDKGVIHKIPHGQLVNRSIEWAKIDETPEAIEGIKKTLRQGPASKIPDESLLCKRLAKYEPKLWATVIRDLRHVIGLNKNQIEAKNLAEKYLVGWMMAVRGYGKSQAETALCFTETTGARADQQPTVVAKPRTTILGPAGIATAEAKPGTQAARLRVSEQNESADQAEVRVSGTPIVPTSPAQPAAPPEAGPEQTIAVTRVDVGPATLLTPLPAPTEPTETVAPVDKPSWRERVAAAVKSVRAENKRLHELARALQERITAAEGRISALEQDRALTPPTAASYPPRTIEELVIGKSLLPKLKGGTRSEDGFWVFDAKKKGNQRK